MSDRHLRDHDCDEDYFLGFYQKQGFRVGNWAGAVQGPVHQGRITFIFFSRFMLTFSPSCDPRTSQSSGVLKVCPCFTPTSQGSLAESASFSTLLFAPVSRLLIYMPAPCAAGLQVLEGTKILTSVHAENLLLTPMLHLKKIHSQKPDKIFTAFSSLSTCFTFSHPVFPGLFKIDLPQFKRSHLHGRKLGKIRKV